MTKSLLDNNNVRTPSEDYLSYLIQLSEQERKDVYQEVMKDRTDRLSDRLENQTLGQILGGGINLSERIISGLGGSGFDKIPVFKGTSEEKAFIKAAKDILDNRETKFSGGLLDDDMSRLRLAEGTKEGKLPIFNELETEILRDTYKQLMPYDDRQRQYMADLVRDNPEMSGFPEQYADMDRFLDNKKILLHALENRLLKTNGGLLGDLNKDGKMSDYEQARQDAIDKNMREQKAEGGEMLPDEMMEQNFVDFVVDEALSPEEKSMLEEQLEANPQLSVLFDKVVETASEFTGAGPVDGPGTGTSDDIPARLSDGEFVFTAKAVEQIGADNLMQMMKDAEAAYDAGGERAAMQEGGEAQLEEDDKKVTVEYVQQQQPMTAEQSLLGQVREEDETATEIKKSMMSPFGHVRS